MQFQLQISDPSVSYFFLTTPRTDASMKSIGEMDAQPSVEHIRLVRAGVRGARRSWWPRIRGTPRPPPRTSRTGTGAGTAAAARTRPPRRTICTPPSSSRRTPLPHPPPPPARTRSSTTPRPRRRPRLPRRVVTAGGCRAWERRPCDSGARLAGRPLVDAAPEQSILMLCTSPAAANACGVVDTGSGGRARWPCRSVIKPAPATSPTRARFLGCPAQPLSSLLLTMQVRSLNTMLPPAAAASGWPPPPPGSPRNTGALIIALSSAGLWNMTHTGQESSGGFVEDE
uniref:Uncharacterized protein n=1 Tax=Setaria italica TaxID=4555 RepID=K3YUS0_SETIT